MESVSKHFNVLYNTPVDIGNKHSNINFSYCIIHLLTIYYTIKIKNT